MGVLCNDIIAWFLVARILDVWRKWIRMDSDWFQMAFGIAFGAHYAANNWKNLSYIDLIESRGFCNLQRKKVDNLISKSIWFKSSDIKAVNQIEFEFNKNQNIEWIEISLCNAITIAKNNASFLSPSPSSYRKKTLPTSV